MDSHVQHYDRNYPKFSKQILEDKYDDRTINQRFETMVDDNDNNAINNKDSKYIKDENRFDQIVDKYMINNNLDYNE